MYVSAIGLSHHEFIEETASKFLEAGADLTFFSWDASVEPHEICKQHRLIMEPNGLKWYYAKKYLTPDVVAKYDYIFYWDDDIDILDFNPVTACRIMDYYRIEMAQPALTRRSHSTHRMFYQNLNQGVRFTDFIEIMNPIFSVEAWIKFWSSMENSWNHWGWGYDDYAFNFCDFKSMAILDCLPVHHTKPITFPWQASADLECYDFIKGIENRSKRTVIKKISSKKLIQKHLIQESIH